ncbi:hypothetical protein V6N11_053898 [Hibiscus sabdariffa]|uniref:Uncharacterized protein n=1 Tax=Hibiscus sabdariffa TaxID=183260 RepID=A0ABR2S355_9ROSI
MEVEKEVLLGGDMAAVVTADGGSRIKEASWLESRNIPLDCRPEELRIPFERFGIVRDVYIPKDYHTGGCIVLK